MVTTLGKPLREVVLEDISGQGGLMVSSVSSSVRGGERQIVCRRDERVFLVEGVDETPLCERFGRLFDLVENKSVSVAEMFLLGWGTGGEAWLWRRPLRAWEEEMLGECQTLLLDIPLHAHSSNRWLWQPDFADGYTVCGAYQLLTDQDMTPLDVAASLIWHTQVPLKVFIFAWRLFRDRLPTKANMITRDILPVEDHLCVSGCGAVESAQHVFLSYSTFGSLWSLVNSWIGSSLVTAQTLSDHFV
ncbi:hypothetical protein TSUD_150430 [Trifolium subterraneum]|uniref:Reverse transcriptase zinc-binding domain-containing protein n=1 Tax=Trifolium subterraneum TaxID=3900 RepID=A0A2Z6P3Q8_TRISU|nr:hypothetical protein TSUD_150430 [Trifolium subterraneum]